MMIENTPTVLISGPHFEKSAACEPILSALPEWFGIESAKRQYLKDIEIYPTFLALKSDEVVGFLTLYPVLSC